MSPNPTRLKSTQNLEPSVNPGRAWASISGEPLLEIGIFQNLVFRPNPTRIASDRLKIWDLPSMLDQDTLGKTKELSFIEGPSVA